MCSFLKKWGRFSPNLFARNLLLTEACPWKAYCCWGPNPCVYARIQTWRFNMTENWMWKQSLSCCCKLPTFPQPEKYDADQYLKSSLPLRVCVCVCGMQWSKQLHFVCLFCELQIYSVKNMTSKHCVIIEKKHHAHGKSEMPLSFNCNAHYLLKVYWVWPSNSIKLPK